jgi:sugar phosphate permease
LKKQGNDMVSDGLKKALKYRWVIFWVLSFSFILVYFHRLCAAVLAVDMMHDLNAGGALLGLLGAAYFYPYALMQLPAGLLSDSWGPRKTITLFFGVAVIGSIILGMAPSVSWAIFGRTLVGLGVAMLFVPTMKVLAEWFRAGEFALMTGIFFAMGGIGTISAATPLAVLSSAVGWRMSFILVGIFTIILGALVWIFVRDRPADKGWPSPSEHVSEDQSDIGLWEGVKKVLSNPWFWPIAIWFFFNCAIFFSFGGLWGGPYLMNIYGLSKAQAGNILSMLAFGMIVGSPMMGYISNRILKGRKPVLIISSVITLIITVFLAFFTGRLPIWFLYVLTFGMGMFTNAIAAIGFTTTKELFPVQIAGTSTGLVNLFPFLGGAILQPIMGYMLERAGRVEGAFTVTGYRHAFFALFLCGIIALAATFFLKETLTKENSG